MHWLAPAGQEQLLSSHHSRTWDEPQQNGFKIKMLEVTFIATEISGMLRPKDLLEIEKGLKGWCDDDQDETAFESGLFCPGLTRPLSDNFAIRPPTTMYNQHYAPTTMQPTTAHNASTTAFNRCKVSIRAFRLFRLLGELSARSAQQSLTPISPTFSFLRNFEFKKINISRNPSGSKDLLRRRTLKNGNEIPICFG